MLISRMAICWQSANLAALRAYSSTEKPQTLAMSGPWNSSAMAGSSSPITVSMPGFWSPTALSIPDGVSAMRGVGLPMRGASVVPLSDIEPRMSRSYMPANSRPNPKVPEAGITGFLSVTPESVTDRSGCSGIGGGGAWG